MRIDPLGELERDATIPEWFLSNYTLVPYLGGDELRFIIEGIEDDPAPSDFEEAITNFLALPQAAQREAEPYLFTLYRSYARVVSEKELGFALHSESEILDHIDLTAVHVSRRAAAERDVYVQVTGNCDWDREHGVQIVLRRGKILCRVSEQDGHLTTSDAYDMPESRNTITYDQ